MSDQEHAQHAFSADEIEELRKLLARNPRDLVRELGSDLSLAEKIARMSRARGGAGGGASFAGDVSVFVVDPRAVGEAVGEAETEARTIFDRVDRELADVEARTDRLMHHYGL
jgi:hypothetical protein